MQPWLAFLIITALECILLAAMPSLHLLFTILWGTTLIIAALYLGRNQLIIIFIANVVMLFSFMGFSNAFTYMLLLGTAGLVMCYLTNIGKDYYFIQNWGAITAAFGVSIFLVFFYYGTDQTDIANWEAELNTYLEEVIESFEQSDLYEFYEEQEITLEEVQQSFNEMVTVIFKHLPAFFYLQAIMVVFFMLFLAQLMSRMLAINRLRKKAFIKEIMPWQLVWVFIAGLGLWILGREQASAYYYMGSNILAVIAPIALYYGISVIGYFLSKRKNKKNILFIILTILVVLFFTIPVIILLGLIGLFDALIDYRKIRLHEEVKI